MHKLCNAFTLIELLVVIAIIAILSIVVLLTLNPGELLRQSRDSSRVSDMATLTSAISLYNTDQSLGHNFNMGLSNIVYVSIPDPVATSSAGDQCQGLSLPVLPTTYSYHCTTSTTIRNVDGTGWIPIDFSKISSGIPLGALPIDPTNQSSTRLYYTYTTNGAQYEITASMESSKYGPGGSNDIVSSDGGSLASVFEKGSKLSLEPLDYGDSSLVGFWPLNEGTGTVVYDYSGNNETGSWNGTPAGTSGYYSSGQVQSYAGAFNGTSSLTYVYIAPNNSLNITGALTISAWVLPTVVESGGAAIVNHRIYNVWVDYGMYGRFSGMGFNYNNGSTWYDNGPNTGASLGIWQLFTITRDNGGNTVNYYINGTLILTTAGLGNAVSVNYPLILGADVANSGYFVGSINNIRIYNRALSAAQISALYASKN